MELISVIVPVYNVEQYLERCVESIRNQTYSELEIILVDDGSPDGCPKMCDTYAQKDKRIKVVHKQNAGLGMARNSGLEVASGVYVTFVDSDDWIGVDHIDTLYQAIAKTQADAAWGSHTIVNRLGEKYVKTLSLDACTYEKDILQKILLPLIGADKGFKHDVQVNASSCMNLYKMEIIRLANICFESERDAVGEDVFFNIDFCYYAKRIVVTQETGYYYFENENSISRKYDPRRFGRTLRYYEVSMERVLRYQLLDKAKERVERSFLMKVRVAVRHVVMAELAREEKLTELRKILHNGLVQSVLASYPLENQVRAMQLLTVLMRRKNTLGVYYLMKLREGAKRRKVLLKLLKQIGIGQ